MLSICVSLLLLSSASGFRHLVADDPLVNLLKELIYEADQEIAKKHKDQVDIPDVGDSLLKLRNGKVGNFSTAELKGNPNITEVDGDDGSITLSFDVEIGLAEFDIVYDFKFSVFGISNSGLATVSSSKDTVRIVGSVVKGSDCSAQLSSVALVDLKDFTITLVPDPAHFATRIEQAIVNFVVPKLVPIMNNKIKDIIEGQDFKSTFSDKVCSMIPL